MGQPGTTWNDDAAGAVLGAEILRALASVYADRPDYDPAWAPTTATGV